MDQTDDLLHGFERRIDEQLDRAERLKAAMNEVRVTAQSRQGDLQVTVDSTGALAALRLSQEALSRTPQELAGEILGVTRSAQVSLTERMRQVTTEVLGRDSETARFVADTYAEHFVPAPQDASR
ncbi:YbaB/EbfC family nucleoid-associated protein [Melissospora conviva]|uniref:YbaB/EbfC family nucleoid-associated protein n=1 Tax=Melissospora conviva TaxID=3388432 RepID=UPI003B7EDDE8